MKFIEFKGMTNTMSINPEHVDTFVGSNNEVHIYVSGCDSPFVVNESYDEVKAKLSNPDHIEINLSEEDIATIERAKQGLQVCIARTTCSDCPYLHKMDCLIYSRKDAIQAIEILEKRTNNGV